VQVAGWEGLPFVGHTDGAALPTGGKATNGTKRQKAPNLIWVDHEGPVTYFSALFQKDTRGQRNLETPVPEDSQ